MPYRCCRPRASKAPTSAVAAEAIFGWGCKHFPRAPRQHRPQERWPLPNFYNAVFHQYWCIIKSCQSSPHFAFVVTVQTQLCAKKNQSDHRYRCTQPSYLLRSLKVTGSNIEQEIVPHPEQLKRNRRRQKYLHDVYILFQYRFDLQTSPLD